MEQLPAKGVALVPVLPSHDVVGLSGETSVMRQKRAASDSRYEDRDNKTLRTTRTVFGAGRGCDSDDDYVASALTGAS